MEADSWARLYSSFRRHQYRSDAFCAEDCEGEEDHSPEFLCPFCMEEFDIVGLCCHIDEEHEVEAMNRVCPICVENVGSDLVRHMTTQHGNILTISFSNLQSYRSSHLNALSIHSLGFCLPWFFFLTKLNVQRRRRLRRGSSNLSFSMLRREPDALLTSFVYSPQKPADDDEEPSNVLRPTSLIDPSSMEESSVEAGNQSLLSDEDMMEHTRRCEFVQELLLSAFLDDCLRSKKQ